MSGIRVEHICKAFKDFKAVDDVSFDVKQGELAALLGPSGSGKSTILRIISGLERPDSGEIFLAGQEVTRQSVRKRKIGFVFQHYALFKHMTVEQNIAFGLQVQKKGKSEIKKKVAELIDLVKLNGYDNHFPSQLSGGQQQRVALARALAPEPAVLLLDEPFGSLDAKVRKNLAQWIRDLHKRIHVTGIFVTHDQNEAMEIADKIILINRGRVEQIGSPHEIYETPASKFVASFVGNVNVIEAYIEKGNVFIKGADESIVFHQEEEQRQEGDVVLLVRPEDVTIHREACSGKHIPGRINGIHYRGSFYEIDLEVGSSRIKSVINKENFMNSGWQPEEEIFAHFKAYKVFEVSEGFHKIHDMLKQLGYIE